ncbi:MULTISPECIES: putative mucin/carbohydrate-binding domain-containing protein [Bacillus]|uniref:putative mucin/carbohydrate-binding domain-containing protein n=1 Tax=Bacillus TaxID=1386 RepID=UPI000DC55EC6|nr:MULTISPECIES: putative mucin/carbohydrate-binding domain-containing protein [Bacillus]RAN71024.1 wall-associated protein [Bacillus sp. SRB_8]WJE64029.1 putative mucin/carbohydrate-binding domain-containing protein [Bacillus mycoides]
MSKKKKSRVLVAGICISTLLSPVAFEASKGYAAPLEENKGGNLEENKFEQRAFQLPSKGSVDEENERLRVTWKLSANEPTGIYAAPNEEITIDIKGTQSIQAFIGTGSYDEKDPEEFDLKPGKNVISSPRGGILYFYNMNSEGNVTATVTNGGSHFPLFILGKHTKKDWDEMLKKYKDPYAVELKGERSLVTTTYDSVQKYTKNTDPTELMKLHDKIIRLENAVAGLSEDGVGVAKSPTHYVQFVEKRKPAEGNFMFATNYHTGYIPTAMNRVLDLEVLEKDGWGPWHEVGHLHQQEPWKWSKVREVTVNIYSLAVQKALGNQLEMDEHYKESFEYLERPKAERVIDEINPLTMFWQLNVVYGEHFYPRLHQAYRLLPQSEMPNSDEEKKQLFIYMTSKVAGQNLIPFFEEWGLTPNDDTREKIEKLNLPKLEKEIWKATDSNDIRERQVEPYKVPYGEPANEVQNLLVGTDSDENEASKLVQNLGENVKVTGKIIWPKLENGKQEVLVEIEDEKGNKNSIPVQVNGVYGDSIIFQGLSNEVMSTVMLRHNEKKLNVNFTNNKIHYRFEKEEYMGLTVYDRNGIEKKSVSAEGQENGKRFALELNGLDFEYGDVVKVFHAEPDRLKWYQNNALVDQGNAKKKKEKLFQITPQGFEFKDGLQEVTAVPQKVVIGTDAEKLEAKNFVQVKDGDSLLVYGLSYGTDDMKSIITLHHDTKKLSATDTKNLIHDYFKDEKYFEFTLYDKEGKEKENIAVKGLENTKAFAKEVNGLAFEYGDVVKVYHAESSRLHWYQKDLYVGEGNSKEIKELVFKITENGFERLDGEQTVKENPQKVVVGTDVEKLEAKNFVEVKDGEVVGFVEKPNTSKIGEQKVKVETKDRFGNKKVTEVPLEVIYGDSIMFFGTSYGGTNIKSVVTLNHEEKKFGTTDSEGKMHTSFADEKYMGMTVYDKDGKEKKAVSVKASENTKAFAEKFKGMSFEYGDIVKVYQREFDRFKVYKKNEFVDAQYGVHEVFFKVTEQGFERMEAQQEIKAVPQKIVIGTDDAKLNAKDFVQVKDGEVIGFVEKPNTTKIGEQKVKVETKDRFGNKKVTEVSLEVTYGDSLVFKGLNYSTDIKSIVTLQHDQKKFSTTADSNPVHHYFKEETYFEFTLLDQKGMEKKKATVKGVENTKEFAKAINGLEFEYGDVVKVYHAESDRFNWYQNNNFTGQGKAKVEKELFFKVTEKGFERIEALQEVKAVQQKVVIGTDAEKLEVKNFVEVKDGEVIGFVEKPDTMKLGEQKVKVETKDRFGNKTITEVPIEVTYGDSLVYQGVSNVTRSIVTLNHDEKKLHATFTNDVIHYRFVNEQYLGFTIYDQNGNEKKHISADGQETSKNFAEQVNGTPFEYGDVVKVYHAEPSRLKWYKKNELAEQVASAEVVFKITQSGLELVKGTL